MQQTRSRRCFITFWRPSISHSRRWTRSAMRCRLLRRRMRTSPCFTSPRFHVSWPQLGGRGPRRKAIRRAMACVRARSAPPRRVRCIPRVLPREGTHRDRETLSRDSSRSCRGTGRAHRGRQARPMWSRADVGRIDGAARRASGRLPGPHCPFILSRRAGRTSSHDMSTTEAS